MFNPNVIGAGVVGAWHAMQNRYNPPPIRGRPSGGGDGDGVLGGLVVLALIAGVVIYFLC
jgi:hypothetical protein